MVQTLQIKIEWGKGGGRHDFVHNPTIDIKNVAFYVSFHKLLAKIVVRTFFESVERTQQHNGYAVLPYIKDLTEFLKRRLEKHDMKVFSKPVTTLQQQFPSLKHRPTMEEQTNIIYKIPCKDCSWSYIGETGRSLKTRKSEHFRNVEHRKRGSNVAKHAWTHDHVIDFGNSQVIDNGSHRTRKTLESWHTALTNNADNNYMLLPGQYTMLTKKNTYSIVNIYTTVNYQVHVYIHTILILGFKLHRIFH